MGALSRIRRRLGRRDRVESRLAAIEQALRAQQRRSRETRKLLVRTQAALDALVRHAFVDPDALPYPQRLTIRRFGVLSQNGEDGLLLALLGEAGVATRRFVEIGCGTNGGNSGFLARELGWSGVMVDGSEEALVEARLRVGTPRVAFVHERVNRENVDDLLRAHGATGELDVLSIDIDGNDYWVWEALGACSPRVVIVEYNALWGPDRAVAVPYDPDFRYEPGGLYFGASLAALAALGRRKGYRLVAVEPRGVNAFFLRDDVAPHVPATDPRDAYAALFGPAQLYADPLGPDRARKLAARASELEVLVREQGLPLEEVT